MTDAPDSTAERMAEYQRLFATVLIAREKTVSGVRWRFRASDGIESQIRDLAAGEQSCCAFFTFTITTVGGEVLWDASVVDDEIARSILEEFYLLPDTIDQGALALNDRFAAQGFRVHINDGSGLRLATFDEMGLSRPATST